ncbi:DUF1499 domain-containing protein [Anaerobacillus isosaccharinicus]|uniref:DUF1499 domain-containing protein n=1 Tax=Anaerobacillus isosaccharinicus TaxID=1532552 RepID=A0A1S2ME50_9BACI|nr:hypothetical protein [Anaerobacillus isosaccharinicus]MBA5587917.1 DUF1499 domain-containing protein [Anaerobacillus isosaccharinicus]QOY33933.1 DUF1499 domain-containing protein [Anaerobacillus isosaccharinicus]
MGFKDKINKFISTHTETREAHSIEALKTRYYKAMKNKAFDEVLAIFQQSPEFQVGSSDLERGEIIVKGNGKRKFFLVATIIMVSPNRTAIDFSVTTETSLPLDFGFSETVIKDIYRKIDKRLEYVGSGLGA